MYKTYYDGEFPERIFSPAISTTYKYETFLIGNQSIECDIEVHDAVVPEHFDRLCHVWFRDTEVFIYCFSFDDENSVTNIQQKWIPKVHHHSQDALKILVGLKSDLKIDYELLIQGYIHQLKCNKLNIVTDVIQLIRSYFPVTNTKGKIVSRSLIKQLENDESFVKYMEVSAKNNENVNELFQMCAECYLLSIYEKYKPVKQSGCCLVL